MMFLIINKCVIVLFFTIDHSLMIFLMFFSFEMCPFSSQCVIVIMTSRTSPFFIQHALGLSCSIRFILFFLGEIFSRSAHYIITIYYFIFKCLYSVFYLLDIYTEFNIIYFLIQFTQFFYGVH